MSGINDALRAAADQFGTPLYVYDSATITRQYEKLKKGFSGHKTRFFYACKALSNVSILRHIHSLGAGLDCVSINEVRLGLHVGFAPDDILFTPNSVTFEELVEAKNLGVNLNIDNISLLERFGAAFGGSYPVCVRLNPHIEAGGNYKIQTGHIDSKFGISIHQLRHLERVVKGTGLHVRGLHMHTGSEIKDVGVFMRALEILFDAAGRFPELDFLDLGSGFKVPYKPGDAETDVATLGKQVAEAFKGFEKEYGRPLECWFEPGKYLVSESGYLLVNVAVVKQTTATVFAGVNSGFNHLIRPMFYDSYHHISNLTNPKGTERLYTVVGNICETDTFAWDRLLPEIRENDLLAFHNAGAYGFEMSSSFNSRTRPAEVLLENGKLRLIRHRQTFEDLLAGQVDAEEVVRENAV
ncbi:diaminopimelate decarboxylase [Hymenobacter sp. BT770]|uniref:diaminopimelate decarboxylase n=1 Tax=Hymenobacter sp. BT770 TaxID=2886942 RepID=UPI001D11E0A3|nr:diaminopimelate decarboxylase [Hymenobacter sp. BT770]MCC3154203.1 diaminopimelate decarboxylase [Hymenobacter sp. BT770]MDO3414350.1 diaminopimelate decarboxylase [Hymenobacter sp. BT770]